MLKCRIQLAIVCALSILLVACEKPVQQATTVAFGSCSKGISRKQINDLIAILNEFSIARPSDVEAFLNQLGGPKHPTISPGCYNVRFTDVLAGIIPKRMVTFNLNPFKEKARSFEIKTTYKKLVRDFANATLGEWEPYSVRVLYRESNGAVIINFDSFDKKYKWQIDQHEAIDRVGDEFFDNLVKLEVNKLSGMYYNLTTGTTAYFAYLPKKLVPELSRLGVK